MSITAVKDSSGRTRYQFEFDRRIEGQRQRLRKLLPKGWTRAQAEAFDRQECAQLYAFATGVEQRRHTIDEAVAHYFDERCPELKHGAGYRKEINLMAPFFIGRPMGELAEVCAEYLGEERGRLKPATIKNRMRYLISACRFGWKHHKMCASDPGAGVVFPAVSNERQVYITRPEMLRLARKCQHWQTRALIRIAFYSGMRLGEILAAEVEGGHFVLADSKNGDPVKVPIHPKIRALVDYPWPTRYIVSYQFRLARALVGMDHLHFHDIRHSTASDLVSSGHSLFVVGKVLRHKSQASTGRYAHLRDEVLNDAINSIGRKRA